MILSEERADYSEMDAIGVRAEIIGQKLFDVCASAEGLAVLAANDDDLHCCLMVKLGDCLHDVVDHHLRQRVQVLGTVEPDSGNLLIPCQFNFSVVVLPPACDSLLQKIQSLH